MWKRLPRYHRPRDRIISNPVLIETSFDEETLANIPSAYEVREAQRTPTESPSSAAKDGRGALKGLPSLPA